MLLNREEEREREREEKKEQEGESERRSVQNKTIYKLNLFLITFQHSLVNKS